MIVVKVEMWPATNFGVKRELMRMTISNDGTLTGKRGSYNAGIFRRKPYGGVGVEGYKSAGHDYLRRGRVENFPKESYHVGRLVLRALKACFPEER